MRPTFLGFETAKSAINVSQKALDVVGNNLANIDTPGYTRQRLDTVSVAPSSRTTRIGNSRLGLAGQGVEGVGVSQTRDAFLDKRFRDEYSTASYYIQSASILGDIQSALGDAANVSEGGDVLAQAFNQLSKSLTEFQKNPTSASHANLVLSSFTNITQVMQSINTNLNGVRDQQVYDLNSTVGDLNTKLEKIAHLNATIAGDSTVLLNQGNPTYRPNELLDQRNLLLDDISGLANVNVKTLSDGTVTVELAGHVAVNGSTFDGLNVLTDETKGTVTLGWKSDGQSFQPEAGALLAYTDLINGRGPNLQNTGETLKQGIPYYNDRMDTLARTFANVMNNIIPDMEEDPPGSNNYVQKMVDGELQYKELISAKNGAGATDSSLPITAGNIAVSDLWSRGGADYFFADPGSKTNTQYAEMIQATLNGAKIDFISYGESFTGSLQDYMYDYSSKVGADVSFYENRQQVTSAVANGLNDRRDEISGVAENEETMSMMTYQKSYNAAARLMTTLDEILDKLINGTGRVGL